jgi:ribulose-phosphate 3-epimerase
MKKLLAPSILSADFAKISESVKIVENSGADIIHLDVMDGHFVPNITFGPKMVKDINKITDLPLDVHLMINEPEKYINEFAKAGADWISVHYETCKHLNRVINQIKENKCKAGVVINPATSVENLNDILPFADFVLLMSVNPGFGGQKFIDNSYSKLTTLKNNIDKNNYNVFIEMDGGIDLNNIEKLSDSGVDVFVCGNSVFGADDIPAAISKMKKILSN